MDKVITQVYSGQIGGDLPFFVGKQYGSGWLHTLAKFAFPILKRIFGVASNTAEDVIMKEKKFLQSLGKNTVDEIQNFMTGKAMPINRTRKSLKNKIITCKLDESATIFKK